MKKILFSLVLTSVFIVTLYSCRKEPGDGGKASIYGKVFVRDYNSTFTVLEDEYYGQDIYVYIIYGDDKDYSDRIRTSYDGTYEFKYLRPGKYHIYTYSKDSTLQTNALIPVVKDVEITKNREEIEVPLINICN
jgi:hypothetical protein